MRTTLNIDDELIAKAAGLTGIKEKTSLVRLGLEALIARESAKRLAKLGGTEQILRTPRRRRDGNDWKSAGGHIGLGFTLSFWRGSARCDARRRKCCVPSLCNRGACLWHNEKT